MKNNKFRMWPNGPLIELPDGYHWDAETQHVVANDLSWRGALLAFWERQNTSEE